jgi:hypothetical protein
VRSRKFFGFTSARGANHLSLIRHFLIDFIPQHPLRDANCAKIFVLCMGRTSRAKQRRSDALCAQIFSFCVVRGKIKLCKKALFHRPFCQLHCARNPTEKFFAERANSVARDRRSRGERIQLRVAYTFR